MARPENDSAAKTLPRSPLKLVKLRGGDAEHVVSALQLHRSWGDSPRAPVLVVPEELRVSPLSLGDEHTDPCVPRGKLLRFTVCMPRIPTISQHS